MLTLSSSPSSSSDRLPGNAHAKEQRWPPVDSVISAYQDCTPYQMQRLFPGGRNEHGN